MRPSKKYQHFITNSVGQSYYVAGYDNEGVPIIKLSTLHNWLYFSPKNWKDVEIAFGRDLNKYHGINRTFTAPYEFVNDGAEIVRDLLIKKGLEEKAYVIILQHNHLTDIYEDYYKGEIDFKQIDDSQPSTVTVNLIEGGFVSLLNANDETDYEFNFDADAIEVVHDGVELQSSLRYQVVPLEEYFYGNHIIPITFLSNEGFGSGIEFKDENYENPSVTYSANSNNYIYKNDNQQVIELSGEVKVTLVSSSGANQLFYRLGYYLSPAANLVFFSPVQTIHDGQTVTFPVNATLTIPAGQKLFIGGRSFVTNAGDNIPYRAKWETTNLTIRVKTRQANSIIKAYKPFNLLQKVIGKITDNPIYSVQSTLLNTFDNLVVTSGDAIRGIETATLKTSFNDFFKAFNAILFASFSINGLVGFFESRKDVYDSNGIDLNAGEVSDFNLTVAKELLFNTIKAGYPNQTYDDLNGKLEFNTTMGLSTPSTEKKELDLVSPYRADPFGIEYLRINLEGKTTTDSSSDNSVFVLSIKYKQQITGVVNVTWLKSTKRLRFTNLLGDTAKFANATFKLFNASDPLFNAYFHTQSVGASGLDLDVFVDLDIIPTTATFTAEISFPAILNRDVTLLTGGLPESIYNIPYLTPKQMLYRHGSWIRSAHFRQDHLSVMFRTLDKNKELSYTFNGKTFVEKADILIGTLEPILFYPFIFTSKTRVPDTFQAVMLASINSHIQVDNNTRSFYGFPLNMTVKPVFNEAQTWKLLASPLNNIDELLDVEPFIINQQLLNLYNMWASYLSPVQLVPVGNVILPQYNSVNMDAGLWHEQIKTYVQKSPYKQKWQLNDVIRLQVYTYNIGPVQMDLIDCNGKNVSSIPFDFVVTNSFLPPYLLWEVNVPLAGLVEGHYFMIVTAGSGGAQVQFISELLDVRAVHANTLLFTYKNRKNKLSTLFTEGYNPTFRIEAELTNYTPKLNFSSYEDEPADMELIESIPYDTFTLEIGKTTVGIPPYMIKKLNSIMGLTEVFIDDEQYTREEGAQFEAERINGVAGAWWKLDVRKAINRQDNRVGTDGNLNRSVVVVSNIQSKMFGDLAGQVSSNIVQVTRVENPQ